MGARFIPIEGSQHEILREADRYQDQLWGAFDDWRRQFHPS
jgi:alpha-beta hydrolase superfamily lysophospholipase